MDVDSSGNNNDRGDIDSFLVNRNLDQGQIAVHKIFGSNEPVNAMHYIPHHQ